MMVVHRQTRPTPQRPNEAWSLDFFYGQLSDGQKFRMLTVVDVFIREALEIEVGQSIWSRLSTVWLDSAEHPNICLLTTEQNLPAAWWIYELTTIVPGPTSAAPASRQIMPIIETRAGRSRMNACQSSANYVIGPVVMGSPPRYSRSTIYSGE